MPQKKPTQKKKSALNSQPTIETLAVFDTVAGKVVGKVIRENANSLVLAHPGILTFRFEAERGGESFKVIGNLQGWMPYTKTYELFRAGIRGRSDIQEQWLHALYMAHAARAETGAYSLHPSDPGVSMPLQEGAAHSDPSTVEVGVLNAPGEGENGG